MSESLPFPSVVVRPLAPDQIRLAYPLMREACPGLDLASWMRYARQAAGPPRAGRSGIIGAWRLTRPVPCGLFCYRREQDLALGPVLVAEHFIAVDILAPDVVLNALLAELDGLAARLGCVAVRSVVRERETGVAARLSAAGHRPEGATLCKPLGGARAPRPVVPV